MSPKWKAFASVACGTFMATLDSSIVNIALPTLTNQLGTNLVMVKWVVVVYLLAIICFLLPAGRFSDFLGRRRTFILGFAIFAVGSVLCGISWSVSALILSRMIQGMGAALLMSNGPAVISSTFPPNERGGALGTMSMVVSAGLVSGPSIGGLLISHVGWRSIFLVNIPVAALGLYLAGKYIDSSQKKQNPTEFDWLGAVLQALMLIVFLISLDPPQTHWFQLLSRFPGWQWLGFAFAGALFLLFLRVESRASFPLIDLSLLRLHRFWMPNLAGFLIFVSFSAVSVLMPFFFEEELGLSPPQAGMFMTAIPLAIFVVAPISGRVSDRVGSSGLSIAGGLVGALALLMMGGYLGPGLSKESSAAYTVFLLSLIGVATGLFQSPNNSAIMNAVPTDKLGLASALLATFRNLGLIVGTGVSTSIFYWKMSAHGSRTDSIHFTFLVFSILALSAAVISFIRKSH